MNAKDNIPAWAKDLQLKAKAKLKTHCKSIRLNSQHIATDSQYVAEFYSGWDKDGVYIDSPIQVVYFRIESSGSPDYPGWFEFYFHVPQQAMKFK